MSLRGRIIAIAAEAVSNAITFTPAELDKMQYIHKGPPGKSQPRYNGGCHKKKLAKRYARTMGRRL